MPSLGSEIKGFVPNNLENLGFLWNAHTILQDANLTSPCCTTGGRPQPPRDRAYIAWSILPSPFPRPDMRTLVEGKSEPRACEDRFYPVGSSPLWQAEISCDPSKRKNRIPIRCSAQSDHRKGPIQTVQPGSGRTPGNPWLHEPSRLRGQKRILSTQCPQHMGKVSSPPAVLRSRRRSGDHAGRTRCP